LLQNNFIVSDKKLYSKDYHYRPGISATVVNNLHNMALQLISLYSLKKNDLIVDLGCNDGTLLNAFKSLGFKNVAGVEPTNIYKFALKKRIPVINDFFNVKSAKKIQKKFGNAKLITTTNVFAHTGQLGEFIKGVKTLIDNKTGVFVIENHYLLDIIKKLQFDSFYHEHLRTYSLKSLIRLLNIYKLKPINAFVTDRYNGNIQAHFVSKKNIARTSGNVDKVLNNEKKEGLDDIKTYYNFSNKIEQVKQKLFNYLNYNKNKLIIGKAYPARASVILNYFNSLKDRLKLIAEQHTSLKINKYISGTSIKIVNSDVIKKIKPDIIVIFAWHLFHEIKNKWKKRGLSKKTKFVLLLPSLKIYK
jgi:SAM-dependent methyltransferase